MTKAEFILDSSTYWNESMQSVGQEVKKFTRWAQASGTHWYASKNVSIDVIMAASLHILGSNKDWCMNFRRGAAPIIVLVLFYKFNNTLTLQKAWLVRSVLPFNNIYGLFSDTLKVFLLRDHFEMNFCLWFLLLLCVQVIYVRNRTWPNWTRALWAHKVNSLRRTASNSQKCVILPLFFTLPASFLPRATWHCTPKLNYQWSFSRAFDVAQENWG